MVRARKSAVIGRRFAVSVRNIAKPPVLIRREYLRKNAMTAHTHVDQARSVVLVVDDDTIILWGTASLLESLGFEVIRANSGSAALEALQDRQEIGALITDFEMPRMSGIELAEAAQILRPNLPVVIATGHTTLKTGEGHQWITLAKPFTRDELQLAIARALNSNDIGPAHNAD